MCPDCSPPSARSRRDHLLHHVLVADRAPHQVDAALAERDLEADVAHHGRDDGVAAQPARRPSGARRTSASPRRRRRCGPGGRRRSRGRRRRRTRRPAGTRRRHDLREPARDGSTRSRRLMLRPSGAHAERGRPRSPGRRNSRGATVAVAPFAQSTAIRTPAEARARRAAPPARASRYGADQIASPGHRPPRRRRAPPTTASATIASTCALERSR